MPRPASILLVCAIPLLLASTAFASDETDSLKTLRFSILPAKGLGFEEGLTRRDPSDVIEVKGRFYVWYTRTTRGASGYDATIWYAVSEDGHTWIERGEALGRGPEGAFDERSVFTPGILAAKGAYWLFYTAVKHPFDARAKTAIGLARADSPDGPFTRISKDPVLVPGEAGTWIGPSPRTTADPKGAWDSHRVDDACLITREGKCFLYYKGRRMGLKPSETRMGLAVAEQPEGPYVKWKDNPVQAHGHEVLAWPLGTGVASLASQGPASFWFAEDGKAFKRVAEVKGRPNAPGAYRPQAFTDARPAENFAWGISMIHHPKWPYLVRFEMHRPRVLIIGDSISMGYTPFVRKTLAAQAEVLHNKGNAQHSRYGLSKLDEWLGDVNWEVILFNHGLHDLKYVDDRGKNVNREEDGHIQIPLEDYAKNLEAIVLRLKKTKAHLLFATTTPYPDEGLRPLRKPGYAERYNEAALRVMRKHGIEVCDLHGHVLPHLERYQQPRNVHFTKEGSAFLGEKAAGMIAEALKARR